MSEIDLQDRQATVAKLYSDNSDIFFLPPAPECFEYAQEEYGEIWRAKIKAARPGDLRRQPLLNLDVPTEIGDYKMMLLACNLSLKHRFNYLAAAYSGEKDLQERLFAVARSSKYFGDLYRCFSNGFQVGEVMTYPHASTYLDIIIRTLEWHEDPEKDELRLAIEKQYARCKTKREVESKRKVSE